jgi:hypothetical protein
VVGGILDQIKKVYPDFHAHRPCSRRRSP